MNLEINLPERVFEMLREHGESGSAAVAIVTEFVNERLEVEEEDFATIFKNWCIKNKYI